MGRTVNLSPLGLYRWDQTIFDLMVIPSALNKDTLVDNLLAETAELEVLYPNPVVFKNLLGVWSNKNLDVWNRLYETTQYEYNPIENYNRYETGSEDSEGTTRHTGTDTTTHGGTDTVTETKAEGGTETEENGFNTEQGGSDATTLLTEKGHWIAGYDSAPVSQADDGLVKQTRDREDGNNVLAYGKTEEGSGNKETTFGKTENNTYRTAHGETIGLTHGEQVTTSNEGGHELHAHGNIGVTTTQKLIKEERQIDLFNIYDIIIEDFKMRFCILVY